MSQQDIFCHHFSIIPRMSEYIDWLNTKVLQKARVIDEAGNMLALRRIETGPAGRLGKWDLPGGIL